MAPVAHALRHALVHVERSADASRLPRMLLGGVRRFGERDDGPRDGRAKALIGTQGKASGVPGPEGETGDGTPAAGTKIPRALQRDRRTYATATACVLVGGGRRRRLRVASWLVAQRSRCQPSRAVGLGRRATSCQHREPCLRARMGVNASDEKWTEAPVPAPEPARATCAMRPVTCDSALHCSSLSPPAASLDPSCRAPNRQPSCQPRCTSPPYHGCHWTAASPASCPQARAEEAPLPLR
jgi:hypothetical protein